MFAKNYRTIADTTKRSNCLYFRSLTYSHSSSDNLRVSARFISLLIENVLLVMLMLGILCLLGLISVCWIFQLRRRPHQSSLSQLRLERRHYDCDGGRSAAMLYGCGKHLAGAYPPTRLGQLALLAGQRSLRLAPAAWLDTILQCKGRAYNTRSNHASVSSAAGVVQWELVN